MATTVTNSFQHHEPTVGETTIHFRNQCENDTLATVLREIHRLPRDLQRSIVIDLLLQSGWVDGDANRDESLSERENQVLVLVASGYSRVEIATALRISPNTAARHISNIYGKLGVSNIAEATSYAIYAGLVKRNISPTTN